jgi:hypothetical protein
MTLRETLSGDLEEALKGLLAEQTLYSITQDQDGLHAEVTLPIEAIVELALNMLRPELAKEGT